MRTPIRNPPDPMYAEIEVHRTMICDRVRTHAFRRAIDAVVRPGDVVLDVGAGSGILSAFAARAGAARVYAVERTAVAALAEELAIANGVGEIVEVIHGDVTDIALPERIDVIVSEWLGGFGIDEGMLVPVIAARDRWLKPGGVMIPRSVTAWAALVHDRYLAETVDVPPGHAIRSAFRRPCRQDRERDLLFRQLPSPRGERQALRRESVVDDGREPDIRSNRRKRRTKRKHGSRFARTERPTRSHSGSAPSSRAASRSRSDPGIRRRTGG